MAAKAVDCQVVLYQAPLLWHSIGKDGGER